MPGKTDRQKKIIKRFDPGTKDGRLKKKEKKWQRAHS